MKFLHKHRPGAFRDVFKHAEVTDDSLPAWPVPANSFLQRRRAQVAAANAGHAVAAPIAPAVDCERCHEPVKATHQVISDLAKWDVCDTCAAIAMSYPCQSDAPGRLTVLPLVA